MLSATQQTLVNEIQKKQGRPIFALCKACGLSLADGAAAKLDLLKLGVIMENPSTGGLFVVNTHITSKPVERPKQAPAENPFQVLRRNEPGLMQACEQLGVMTKEAASQRQSAAKAENADRAGIAETTSEDMDPIAHEQMMREMKEEFAFLNELAEIEQEMEAAEADDEPVEEVEEMDSDIATESSDETEQTENEEMANLSQTSLHVLQQARERLAQPAQPAEETKLPVNAEPKSTTKVSAQPTTPTGMPSVNDDMLIEFLAKNGPNTLARITSAFGRTGVGLASKLAKLVKQGKISQRDRVAGEYVVYLSNSDYLREVSGSVPKQLLPQSPQVNAERTTMVATRDQDTGELKPTKIDEVQTGGELVQEALPAGVAVMKVAEGENVEPGDAVAADENGLVKVVKELAKTTTQDEFFEKADTQKGAMLVNTPEAIRQAQDDRRLARTAPPKDRPGVTAEEPPSWLFHRDDSETECSAEKPDPIVNRYSSINDETERHKHLLELILSTLQFGFMDVFMLTDRLPNVPFAVMHEALQLLNQRRRIVKCSADETPEDYANLGKKYSLWKVVPANNRKKRALAVDDLLAQFSDDQVRSLEFFVERYQRSASSMAVAMNDLVKQGKLVKVGNNPPTFRKPNASVSSILDQIEQSFSVKNVVEKPDENWFPILNRLESLLGGDAGAALAEIQAYLQRRMKDD
jgi:flagellar biosynthesis GTPase FlhF